MSGLEDEIILRSRADHLHDSAAASMLCLASIDEGGLVGFPVPAGIVHVDDRHTGVPCPPLQSSDSWGDPSGFLQYLLPLREIELGDHVENQQGLFGTRFGHAHSVPVL